SLRRRLGAQGPGRLRPVAASFDAGNGLEVTRLRQTMVEQVLLRPAVDLGVFGLDRLLIERRRGRDAFGPQTLGQPFGGASRFICRPPFLRGSRVRRSRTSGTVETSSLVVAGPSPVVAGGPSHALL